MSDQELKSLLSKLHHELLNTDTVSAETLSLVRELEADVHRLVPPDPRPEIFESVLEQAKTLERQFAAKHPVAERFMSQIMDILARMGI
jgi:hypothetical protein